MAFDLTVAARPDPALRPIVDAALSLFVRRSPADPRRDAQTAPRTTGTPQGG